MKKLRIGFTTGSASSAATKAALIYLFVKKKLNKVEIPLPEGQRLTIPIHKIGSDTKGAFAEVVKDAGDDPDVTDGIIIRSFVKAQKSDTTRVIIRGGKGVGVVTKPGLPVGIGEYAINPVPRRQIEESVKEALLETNVKEPYTIYVTIEVPKGKLIAKKTLNPKLGIIGGISILGTRGTVLPFSNEAYKKTIEVEMDVARAMGEKCIVLCTGGRTKKFAQLTYPDLPDVCFIQIADFFGFSLEEAKKRGFEHIIFSCFFGKLIKMAQGAYYTHAKESKIDFSLLKKWCLLAGVRREDAEKISHANTANQALSIIEGLEVKDKILSYIVKKAIYSARKYLRQDQIVTFNLFSFDGELLCQIMHKER